MRIFSALKLFAVFILGLIVWLVWPFYGFVAHNGEAPHLPFGWMAIEDDVPYDQFVHDDAYREAAEKSLAVISQHREQIGAPGISAAVAVDGKLVWQGVAGWADIKRQKPVTPQTQFRIGSTSKAITGTALARLVDKGVIDLDAPISDYLANLPNPDWKGITARQLASHMAGIPHYGDNKDWAGLYKTVSLRQHYDDVRDALEIFDESPLLFEPGTDFSYSSLGTVLLGAVMSEAAGKPYRQVVQEEVLEPAEMSSTIVAPKRGGKHPDLATFYYREDDRYREWRALDLSHRLPGGGFASTSSDLVRMGSMHFDGTYIDLDTRQAFWTPQRLSGGEVNEQDYAIGWRWREWEIEGAGVARNANHGGVSRGAQSWLLVYPDYNMAIAFNINTKTHEFRDFGHIHEDLFREFALAIPVEETAFTD